MSAAEPAPPAGADPSMEDILASIRRILSEEEQPNPAEARPGEAAASPPDDDVLVLEPSMMLPEPGHLEAEQPKAAPAEPREPMVAAESKG
ncbi:MAG: hypothetical protein WBQ75_02000, partial [Acetobacteraceae bacterium]